MTWSKKNKIVLVGAPGVGKSTVIKILTDLGHKTLPEQVPPSQDHARSRVTALILLMLSGLAVFCLVSLGG